MLCLILLICAVVTLSAIEDLNDNVDTINDRSTRIQVSYDDSDNHEAAAGFIIFVAVMGMVIEPLIIILRILSISFINQNFLIILFGIVVSDYDVVVNAISMEEISIVRILMSFMISV